MDSIFHRVSVRKFEERKVENEKINKILRAAMAAPSAMNQQEWEFYVIENEEVLLKLSEVTPYSMSVKNAKTAIVVCYREDVQLPEYTQIDSAIATENILLEADNLGLGAVMIGIAPNKEYMNKVSEVLNITEKHIPFTIIPIGYPLKEKEQQDRFDENKIHYIK